MSAAATVAAEHHRVGRLDAVQQSENDDLGPPVAGTPGASGGKAQLDEERWRPNGEPG